MEGKSTRNDYKKFVKPRRRRGDTARAGGDTGFLFFPASKRSRKSEGTIIASGAIVLPLAALYHNDGMAYLTKRRDELLERFELDPTYDFPGTGPQQPGSTCESIFGNVDVVVFAGQLTDLAGTAVYLCSPASDYITGQTLVVDGGMTM